MNVKHFLNKTQLVIGIIRQKMKTANLVNQDVKNRQYPDIMRFILNRLYTFYVFDFDTNMSDLWSQIIIENYS